jgi:hypothetical protein
MNAQCPRPHILCTCAVPLVEHLPTSNVSAGGMPCEAYSTYSGSGTRYLWRWGAGPGSFGNGLVRANVRDAETDCTLLGGHLPSLHSLPQAEHLLGVYNSLWPRNSGWYYQVDMWLGFFVHLSNNCVWSEDVQAWSQNRMYSQNGPNVVVPVEEIARRSPRAWSDWSAPDYPGMLSWDPQCQGRVLNVMRDTDPARSINTYGVWRGDNRQYVCACEYDRHRTWQCIMAV